MRDRGRQAAVRWVYEHLSDPELRALLSVRDDDGNRPVVVALPNDTMRWLLTELDAHGGAANVVVPVEYGARVLIMTQRPAESSAMPTVDIDADCTVGVFLARLDSDGPDRAYGFRVGRGAASRERWAELAGQAT